MSNATKVPYDEMSFLEVFFDYCVSGIDFSLPGNGGRECKEFIPGWRRAAESAAALALGSASIWAGLRSHRAPRNQKGTDGRAHDPYTYDPLRIVLLVSMTLTFALEACYKLATRQFVFIINPCHLLCVIHIVLLAAPAKYTALQYLFRIHLFYLHGPIIACFFPVTNTLFLPFEVATYWLEHFFLLLVPLYLLRYGAIYTVESFFDPSWIFISYGIWAVYHWVFLDALALFTWANLNSMLCPAISDPFYGQNWRVAAMAHQFVLCAASGKLWGRLGIREEEKEEIEAKKAT